MSVFVETRLRTLHSKGPKTRFGQKYLVFPAQSFCTGCGEVWPCPTVKILNEGDHG